MLKLKDLLKDHSERKMYEKAREENAARVVGFLANLESMTGIKHLKDKIDEYDKEIEALAKEVKSLEIENDDGEVVSVDVEVTDIMAKRK